MYILKYGVWKFIVVQYFYVIFMEFFRQESRVKVYGISYNDFFIYVLKREECYFFINVVFLIFDLFYCFYFIGEEMRMLMQGYFDK